jgi:hypothetical protein
VTANGLTITGTGKAAIVTAPIYVKNTTYAVNANHQGSMPANTDGDGRLHFSVDLGPSHADEQYSPAARVEEAAGQYNFATQELSIRGPIVIHAAGETKRGSEVLPRTGGSAEPLGAVLLAMALLLRRRTRVAPLS